MTLCDVSESRSFSANYRVPYKNAPNLTEEVDIVVFIA